MWSRLTGAFSFPPQTEYESSICDGSKVSADSEKPPSISASLMYGLMFSSGSNESSSSSSRLGFLEVIISIQFFKATSKSCHL